MTEAERASENLCFFTQKGKMENVQYTRQSNNTPSRNRVQILFVWTISIVLSLSKSTILFTLPNTTFRRQVKPIQLGPIDRTSPYLRTF
jgi:hypothetical protein